MNPSSREDKEKEDADVVNRFPRWCYVHELQSMLDTLKPDDWLETNKIGNINIHRGDASSRSIGTIDLYWVRIEYWSDEY